MTSLLNCSFITGTRLTEQERLIALIEKHALISNRRLFHLDFEGNCYVVKMQQKKRSKIGYYILTMIAKVFSIPALRGIPILGGKLTLLLLPMVNYNCFTRRVLMDCHWFHKSVVFIRGNWY